MRQEPERETERVQRTSHMSNSPAQILGLLVFGEGIDVAIMRLVLPTILLRSDTAQN